MARRNDRPMSRPVVVASATKIRLSLTGEGARPPKREAWQDEAFAFRRDIPEIGFATRFVGNAIAKVIAYVGYYPDDADPTAPPMPIAAETSEVPPQVRVSAQAELDRLKSGSPSMDAMLFKYAVNIDITGECYLIGIDSQDGEQWSFRSISEVDVNSDGRIKVKSSPGDPGVEIRDGFDECIRLYIGDPEWSDRASSPMEYLLTNCRILAVLNQQKYAESTSALSAGILLVPNEFSPPPQDSSGDPSDDPDDDPFFGTLIDTLTAPIDDPSSAASIVPAVIRGPGAWVEHVRHITVGRTQDAALDGRIEKEVERIARGLDLPVEVIKGHMGTTFANARQINQDTFEDHLQPRCDALFEMLTVGYFRPHLRSNPSIPPEWAERLVIWYDPSVLVGTPDPAASADEGHDRMVISDAAWRRARGWGEEDAPSPQEILIRLATAKGQMNGDLTTAMIRYLVFGNPEDPTDVQLPVYIRPPAPGGELPVVPPDEMIPGPGNTPAHPSGAQAAPVAASAGQPSLFDVASPDHAETFVTVQVDPVATSASVVGAARKSDLGVRLAAIDRDLRIRLQVATSQAVERALEKAGNRLRAKASIRASVAGIAARERAAHLGPTLVADAGFTADQLLAGAFDAVESDFRAWGATAQAAALAALTEAARLPSHAVEMVRLRQSTDLDESWSWAKRSLTVLAESRLFNPDPSIPALGEHDTTMTVPAGLIRNAMARMGGKLNIPAPDAHLVRAAATAVLTSGTDAWVAIPGTGGVATGDLILDTYRDNGGKIEGYVWDYGAAARHHPFEPHLALNGVTFVNFDDDVLANTEGWPETPYFYPGDHAGCLCDFVPTLLDPPEVPDSGNGYVPHVRSDDETIVIAIASTIATANIPVETVTAIILEQLAGVARRKSAWSGLVGFDEVWDATAAALG